MEEAPSPSLNNGTIISYFLYGNFQNLYRIFHLIKVITRLLFEDVILLEQNVILHSYMFYNKINHNGKYDDYDSKLSCYKMKNREE